VVAAVPKIFVDGPEEIPSLVMPRPTEVRGKLF